MVRVLQRHLLWDQIFQKRLILEIKLQIIIYYGVKADNFIWIQAQILMHANPLSMMKMAKRN